MKPNCGNGFHNFKTLEENNTRKREVCVRCGKILVSNKDMGKRELNNYMDEHRADFMQPTNPHFKDVYGEIKT